MERLIATNCLCVKTVVFLSVSYGEKSKTALPSVERCSARPAMLIYNRQVNNDAVAKEFGEWLFLEKHRRYTIVAHNF